MSQIIGFCGYCGWEHANVEGCWKKTRAEAQEKLNSGTLDPDMQRRLQEAVDRLDQTIKETADFFAAVSATMDEDDRRG